MTHEIDTPFKFSVSINKVLLALSHVRSFTVGSTAAFTPEEQRWGISTDNTWPTKPKLLTHSLALDREHKLPNTPNPLLSVFSTLAKISPFLHEGTMALPLPGLKASCLVTTMWMLPVNTWTTLKLTVKKIPPPQSAGNGFQRRGRVQTGRSRGNRY